MLQIKVISRKEFHSEIIILLRVWILDKNLTTKVSDFVKSFICFELVIEKTFKCDASNGLSYERLKHVLNQRHIREEYLDKNNRRKMRPRRLCKTQTGFLSCWKRCRKSDLDNYGVGVVFYFQFLKYMACSYFFMAVLSIPSMYIFYHGNTEN